MHFTSSFCVFFSRSRLNNTRDRTRDGLFLFVSLIGIQPIVLMSSRILADSEPFRYLMPCLHETHLPEVN